VTSEDGRGKRKLELWGWWLFIGSAVFFVLSTAASGDTLGLFGSLFFLVACIVFLAAHFKPAE
jgi:hypothetical protein